MGGPDADPIENGSLSRADDVAAIDDVERERERLARELHDGPLQDLAAVIRRLDLSGEATMELVLLREIAADLRQIAIRLRPPVLDDLGLGSALSFLVDEANHAGPVPVRVQIEDSIGLTRALRPPLDVELAVFRIAQEAIRNAEHHSAAHSIELRAALAPDQVTLEVADDGPGIDRERALVARREGRMGLSSMSARATTAGAAFRVDTAHGTLVQVRWPAQRG